MAQVSALESLLLHLMEGTRRVFDCLPASLTVTSTAVDLRGIQRRELERGGVQEHEPPPTSRIDGIKYRPNAINIRCDVRLYQVSLQSRVRILL